MGRRWVRVQEEEGDWGRRMGRRQGVRKTNRPAECSQQLLSSNQDEKLRVTEVVMHQKL